MRSIFQPFIVFLLLVTSSLPLQAQTNLAKARLAIVVEDSSIAAAGDLLTAELSKRSDLELLERAQIEKVYREQALSAGNKDYLKLGQVLGADGLIILKIARDDGGQFLRLQLVAVRPGILLKSDRFSWPLQALTDWATSVAERISRVTAKLCVPLRDATAISIVSFRASTDSSETRDLERQLTYLAAERLSAEKSFFVLERTRMQLLNAENELKGLPDSGFWNGSYLLDATIDPDGYAKDTLAISARLTPPRNATPFSIQVSGSRTNLSDIIDQLAAKVLTNLKVIQTSPAWDATAEAARYFEEAKWAYRWDVLSQAQMASEASWALGARSSDLALLRIRSYYEDGVDRAVTRYEKARKLITFGPAAPPIPGEYIEPYQPLPGSGIPPDAPRFMRVRRAMELFSQDFRSMAAPNSNPGWDWHDLGIDLLQGASYWLRHYYYTPEARIGHEEAIADVQTLAKEIARLIGQNTAYANDFGRGSFGTTKVNWDFHYRVPVEQSRETLLATKVNWGMYWSTTPEEGLGVYREIVSSGSMPKVRRLFFNPDWLERSKFPKDHSIGGDLTKPAVLSYLAGWKWEDRRRALKVWHGFIDELFDATNLLMQAEGLFLRCTQAGNPVEFDRSFRELMTFSNNHGDALVNASVAEGLLSDLSALLESRNAQSFDVIGFRSCRDLLVERRRALAEQISKKENQVKIEEQKAYLAGSSFETRRFNDLFLHSDIREEHARVLLPMAGAYRTNLTTRREALSQKIRQLNLEHANSPGKDRSGLNELLHTEGQFRIGATAARNLEDRLRNKLQAPIASTMVSGMPSPALVPNGPPPAFGAISRGHMPPGQVRPGAGPIFVSDDLTNRLNVSRFWPLPERLTDAGEPSQPRLENCRFREGRLWVDIRRMRLGTYLGEETYFNRGVVVSVDLNTFQSELIPIDPQNIQLPASSFGMRVPADGTAFEVYKGWLYLCSQDSVKRYSLKTRTWEDLPIPIQCHARLTLIGERMFLSTDDSIQEMAPDGRSARILASNRRRPAITALDNLDGFDRAPLILGPKGSLIAYAGGRIYEQPAGEKDWNGLSFANDKRFVQTITFDGGIFLISRMPGGQEELFALENGAGKPELLFAQNSRHSAQVAIPHRTLPGDASPIQPLWQAPENVRVLDSPFCIDGEGLWLLAGRMDLEAESAGQVFLKGENGNSAGLLYYSHGESKPQARPIKFQLPKTSQGSRGFTQRAFGSPVFYATPAGLIFADNRASGFWLISRETLTASYRTVASKDKSKGNP